MIFSQWKDGLINHILGDPYYNYRYKHMVRGSGAALNLIKFKIGYWLVTGGSLSGTIKENYQMMNQDKYGFIYKVHDRTSKSEHWLEHETRKGNIPASSIPMKTLTRVPGRKCKVLQRFILTYSPDWISYKGFPSLNIWSQLPQLMQGYQIRWRIKGGTTTSRITWKSLTSHQTQCEDSPQ